MLENLTVVDYFTSLVIIMRRHISTYMTAGLYTRFMFKYFSMPVCRLLVAVLLYHMSRLPFVEMKRNVLLPSFKCFILLIVDGGMKYLITGMVHSKFRASSYGCSKS